MDVARVQDHGRSTLIPSSEGQRGFTVESHPKCPTLHYVREADGVIELHVYDGHGCGKETVVAELLTFLSEKIEMKCTKLKSPTALEMRQLTRLLRYVKGTENMSTVFEMRDSNDRREQLVKRLEVYTDSVWGE